MSIATKTEIRISNISKSFGDTKVLDSVSFTLQKGEILGLLGNNGEGKSTLINLLAGYHECDSGSISFLKEQLNSDKYQFLTENPALFERLSLEDNLRLISELRGLGRDLAEERIGQLLIFFGLEQQGKTPANLSSFGMRKKTALASCFLQDFDFAFLDEPFDGVDLITRLRLISLLKTMQHRNKGFLISTHDMYSISQLATDYLYLINGTVVKYSNRQNSDEIEKVFTMHYKKELDISLEWL
jgi:ABC-type multidrug transport system ATPase subunit